MPEQPTVYDLFIAEMDTLTIGADTPVAVVVGELTRAVKRAQNKHDGGGMIAIICACGHNAWTEHGGMMPDDEPGCDRCDCTRNEEQAEWSAFHPHRGEAAR